LGLFGGEVNSAAPAAAALRHQGTKIWAVLGVQCHSVVHDEAHATFGATECLLVRDIDLQQVGA